MKVADALNFSKQTTNPGMSWDKMQENFRTLERLDAEAKAQGQVLGRYVRQPYADGYAYYQVTAINGTRATVEVVGGIGDDWVLPNWGQKSTTTLAVVEKMVGSRDALARLFAKK
jgi:hypothetical protein